MKFFSTIILLALITYTINTECSGIQPSEKKDCHGKLSDTEKKTYSYCCYYETDNDKSCQHITKDEYDHIKSTIKAMEKLYNTKIKLDCHSLFLKLGFLNILFFLL